MKCVFPPELDDHQLLRYLDGEADSQIIAHLASCPYCSQRSDRLASMQKALTARLFRLECPSSLELGDYQLGMLPAVQARTVKHHLNDCLLCKRELDQLRIYLGDALAPAKLDLFEQARVIVARLINEGLNLRMTGESALTPAYAALRGEAHGPLTFQADGVLVILDIQPEADDQHMIHGQIAADDQQRWTAAQVELRQQQGLPSVSEVNDLGGFQFAGIRSGLIELRIIPSSGPIILLNVDIVN